MFKKGEKHDFKREKTTIHLATLDEETRLYASRTAFSLRKKNGDEWQGEYFYTSIQSAIQGYIKHELKNSKRMKTRGSLDKLILVVKDLDNSVKELAKGLEAKFRIDVPMFDSMCSGGDEDEEDISEEQDQTESPF